MLALDARATIAEAMLLMAERTIRHVPVRRDGVLAGVVTERDLFVLQRQSLRGIGEAIGAAGSTAALAQAAGDIREWSSTLVAQGVAAAFVTRLISRLNDQVTQRAIALACADHGPVLDRACWLALGSEGREEQTIATDQDNGLVLDDRADDATRARMRAFGEAVNASLDACGYPLCRGGIMAGNPAWCLPYGEWAALFEGWIDRGDPQSLLSANVFFDFRALAGDTSLAARLREHLADQRSRPVGDEELVRQRLPRGELARLAVEQLEERRPVGLLEAERAVEDRHDHHRRVGHQRQDRGQRAALLGETAVEHRPVLAVGAQVVELGFVLAAQLVEIAGQSHSNSAR